jgi:ATP adenylyltransferase
MDRLWTPWRYAYLTKASPADPCIFCVKQAEDKDDANLILYRGKHNFAMLNLYPYATGHMMISPYVHVATLEAAPVGTLEEMMRLTREASRHLSTLYRPEGLNLGMNIGQCAGAGVAGHIHMHVLPRWAGDANFMTTVGETRVLPEDLAVTYKKLRQAFRDR